MPARAGIDWTNRRPLARAAATQITDVKPTRRGAQGAPRRRS
ncbi:hypothetical protein BURMUCF2_0264 [Burkholderia multivorans CF2]|nr:hypothetical protein BURMUCGD1_2958 [Burkholderia multivorans CGD1]EJO52963.1 hypothetical protein BURMUCF2_0264 [Burkholderia multivorans CF2]